jgi:hypothetical protein
MKKVLILMITALLFHNCKKDETIIDKDVSGRFELKLTSSNKSTIVSTNLKSANEIQNINLVNNDSAVFSLDTIKSSRSFYFVISNSGQSDITDIKMISDNSNFIVTPSTIPLISGTNSKNNLTLNQVFSIDVLHGTMINGIGTACFLNLGNNFCNLNIQGKTFNGDSIITVKLEAKIKIYAEIMAISLHQGEYQYDLSKRDWLLQGCGNYSIDQMIMFNYYTINPPVTIKNIGNVNIEMSLMSFDENYPIIQKATIHPLDTLNLNLPFKESATRGVGGMIRLESKGTIFDINKLSKGRDGAAYFALDYPDEFWRTESPPAQRVY